MRNAGGLCNGVTGWATEGWSCILVVHIHVVPLAIHKGGFVP